MPVTIQKKSDYQDIREELRKRISLLESMQTKEQAKFTALQERAIADHKKAMDAFKAALANYRSMLELEESFSRGVLNASEEIGPKREGETASVNITLPTSKLPLADFFVKTLGEAGPMSKGELRQVAVDAGYEIDGRHTHATLVNLTRNQRVKQTDDNKYIANEMEKALL
jgi:outer membrane translocation and assembly module TamA